MFKLPFKVQRLTLDQVQLHKQHKQSLRSLQPHQLEALAQLARLIATLERDDKRTEGVMLYWNQLLSIHNRQKADQAKEQQKADKSEEDHVKPLTWKDMLFNPPTV